MYNGDFSKWVAVVNGATVMIPIYNPIGQTTNADGTVTRQPFPGNIVPKSLFSAASQKALGVFQTSGNLCALNTGLLAPVTVGYTSRNNYLETTGTQIYPVNKFSVKGDHIFTDKQRISGYYGRDREHQTFGADGPPTLPGLYSNYNDLIQGTDVFRFSWDWAFTPDPAESISTPAAADWNQDHKPPQEYIGNWQNKFCLGDDAELQPESGPTLRQHRRHRLTRTATGAAKRTTAPKNTVYSYNDDLHLDPQQAHLQVRRGMYQLNHYNGFGRQCEAGCIGFSYQETGVPQGTNPNAGGNAFASFLLGYADSGQIDTVRFIGQQFYYFGGYFQDDFRVSSKLVLNLGLRYDVNLPPTGLGNRWTDFGPTTPESGRGQHSRRGVIRGHLQRLRGQPDSGRLMG